jgi:hypothetical protein
MGCLPGCKTPPMRLITQGAFRPIFALVPGVVLEA